MRQPHAGAVLPVALASLALTSAAAAQQSPAPTSTTPTTTAAPTTTAPTGTTAPADPPRLTNLRVPALLEAQQGHARFLVGVRTSTPARLTVQVTAVKGNVLVKTVQSTADEPAGRVYFLVEATNQQRYQLPAGRYNVRVQATDAQGRVSPPVERVMALRLTPPHGHLDIHLVPLWPSLARSLGLPATGGQLVAAVAPGGVAAKAGLRRGDVITSLGGRSTLTVGALATALRALPGEGDVEVVYRRGTEEVTATFTPSADWTPNPDLTRVYAVIAKREPRSLAYSVARARYLIELNKADEAQALIDAWPAVWRTGAAGQATQALLLERSAQAKKALGAWNRALVKDPRMSAAAFGRGLALTSLNRTEAAAAAYGDAFRMDPKDATAATFQALSLIRADKPADAKDPALKAEALDPGYSEAKVAAGIALIKTGNPARGVVKLREGLLLMDDAARAQALIDEYLEAADK